MLCCSSALEFLAVLPQKGSQGLRTAGISSFEMFPNVLFHPLIKEAAAGRAQGWAVAQRNTFIYRQIFLLPEGISAALQRFRA